MLSEESVAEDEASPSRRAMILTQVADYDVLRVLGRGGMGVVCLARDRLLGRDVALKLMHSGVLASDEELRRFRTEAEAVARLRHPHLIPILESGESDGQAYYTMPLVDGGTLAQRLASGAMPPREAAELVQNLAAAIHHAHSRGVLHRDIKPANIIFDTDGQMFVSDFGLARLTAQATATASGSLLGTPAYLAPEVASGAAAHTTSSDVYALGVVMYECLTGTPPFANESPLALLKAITEDRPALPSSLVPGVDRDLEAICLHALEKDPGRRYGSADAFADDLGRWLRDEPISARRPSVWESVARWSKKNQSRAVLYTMAAVSMLILVISSAVMNVMLTRQQAETSDAMAWSELRRAELLYDFASRLMQSTETLADARVFLDEAAKVQHLSPKLSAQLALRLRILNRLEELESRPLPSWSGGGLKNAWFDAEGRLILDLGATKLHLSAAGAESVAEVPEPKPVAPPSVGLNIDGTKVHVSKAELAGAESCPSLTHPAKVLSLAASHDGGYVATLAEDQKLRIWDTRNGRQVIPAQEYAASGGIAVWSDHSNQLAIWNGGGVVFYDW